MSNPTVKKPDAVTSTERQGVQRSGQPLKVTLIVEHSPNHWDGSAIRELASLIAPTQVELSLIHATTSLLEGLPEHAEEFKFTEQYLQQGIQKQDASKADLLRDLKLAGFTVQQEESYPMTNESVEPILEFLQRDGQELMVLIGSHTPGALMGRNHFFMNLTKHAMISTLMIKRRFNFRGTQIPALFGIDASDATLNAARRLSRLIQPNHLALTLATVQSPVYQENAVLAPYVNQDILNEALQANASMTFEMITDILKPEGFTIADNKVLIGSPATELGYIAERENPSLLIVGSHNHKGFLAWVMGSVSSQLLHWDTHNILVVR